MRVLIALLVIVLFFLVLAFCIQNMEPGQQVTVHFLKYHSPPMPVFAVALAAALVGVLFTGLVTVAEGIKLRVRCLRLSRRIKKLEAEIHSLRNLALGPSAPEAPAPEPSPDQTSAEASFGPPPAASA